MDIYLELCQTLPTTVNEACASLSCLPEELFRPVVAVAALSSQCVVLYELRRPGVEGPPMEGAS